MKYFNTLTSCNPGWCSDKLDLVGKVCFGPALTSWTWLEHFDLVQAWQIGLGLNSLVWTRFDKFDLVGGMGAKGWDGAVVQSILCPKTRWGPSPCHTLLHGLKTLMATRFHSYFLSPWVGRRIILFSCGRKQAEAGKVRRTKWCILRTPQNKQEQSNARNEEYPRTTKKQEIIPPHLFRQKLRNKQDK